MMHGLNVFEWSSRRELSETAILDDFEQKKFRGKAASTLDKAFRGLLSKKYVSQKIAVAQVQSARQLAASLPASLAESL